MKFYLLALVLVAFSLHSCGQDLLQTNSEKLGSYNVNNSNFYINVVKVHGGATSSDFMQVRRIYNDSTYEIVKNIRDIDSILTFRYIADTVTLVCRGKYWAQDIMSDTTKFSINDIFINGRFKPAR